MKDSECVEFLQWCLPRLRMRWTGFRKVRRQVCRRISRRMEQLGLAGAHAYRMHLEADPGEWRTLEALCRVTISRFYRDRGVFDAIRDRVLPELAAVAARSGNSRVRCWSAGCGSGEEPYTMSIVWRSRPAALAVASELEVVATDVDEGLLARARAGRYPRSSVKDVPPDLLAASFRDEEGEFVIRESATRCVKFRRQDIRRDAPDGPFDLVLCRNLVFTYFDDGLQAAVLEDIRRRLRPGGYLVTGIHESLPPGTDRGAWTRLDGVTGIFRFTPSKSLPTA